MAVVLLAACLSGCLVDTDGDGALTIACLGDSNTALGWDGRPARWCEYLGQSLSRATVRSGLFSRSVPVEVVNMARGASTLCGPGRTRFGASGDQLEAVRPAHPDIVLAAFGTNDALMAIAPDDYVRCARDLVAAASPVLVLVGLTPLPRPTPGFPWPKISGFNTAMRAAFEPSQLLDFDSGFTLRDLADDVHLGDEAQRRRAHIARAALVARSWPFPLP